MVFGLGRQVDGPALHADGPELGGIVELICGIIVRCGRHESQSLHGRARISDTCAPRNSHKNKRSFEELLVGSKRDNFLLSFLFGNEEEKNQKLT